MAHEKGQGPSDRGLRGKGHTYVGRCKVLDGPTDIGFDVQGRLEGPPRCGCTLEDVLHGGICRPPERFRSAGARCLRGSSSTHSLGSCWHQDEELGALVPQANLRGSGTEARGEACKLPQVSASS